MRVIPTRVHGVLDYVVGALVIAAPWLLGFARGGAETWVPVVLGAWALLYSLCTEYELGFLALVPLKTHLRLDLGGGILLAAAPWLFGFGHVVWVPHLAVGLMEIVIALTTERTPSLGYAPGHIRSRERPSGAHG